MNKSIFPTLLQFLSLVRSLYSSFNIVRACMLDLQCVIPRIASASVHSHFPTSSGAVVEENRDYLQSTQIINHYRYLRFFFNTINIQSTYLFIFLSLSLSLSSHVTMKALKIQKIVEQSWLIFTLETLPRRKQSKSKHNVNSFSFEQHTCVVSLTFT